MGNTVTELPRLRNTVAGTLEHSVRQYGYPLCETQCLNLAHRGTGDGSSDWTRE